jgi:hypothetical protein
MDPALVARLNEIVPKHIPAMNSSKVGQ